MDFIYLTREEAYKTAEKWVAEEHIGGPYEIVPVFRSESDKSWTEGELSPLCPPISPFSTNLT